MNDKEEDQLLLSDDEQMDSHEAHTALADKVLLAEKEEFFYEDRKADRFNTKVTTLYYPGRPHYCKWRGVGAGASDSMPRVERYFSTRLEESDQSEKDAWCEGDRATLYSHSMASGQWGRAIWFASCEREVRLALVSSNKNGHWLSYVRALFHYGCSLRMAGLFEQLVSFVDLACHIHFSAPRVQYEQHDVDDEQLLDYEDKCTSSGLPLSVVWHRVERARAMYHWRPLTRTTDPQRSIDAAAQLDLLPPLVHDAALFLLGVFSLQWAGVPFLCATEENNTLLSLHGEEYDVISRWQHSSWEALLAPMLIGVGSTHSAAIKGLVGLLSEPPHCFGRSHGFDDWLESLWATVIDRCSGSSRLALLLWRLRWLRAMSHLSSDSSPFIRLARLSISDRPSPLLACEFSLIPPTKPHSLWLSLRASLSDAQSPVAHSLRIARMIYWHCGEQSGAWALAYAVCRLRPPDKAPTTRVCGQLMRQAQIICEARCAEIEAHGAKEDCQDMPWQSMLPSEEPEWGSARVLLAEHSQLSRLVDELSRSPRSRYVESSCESISLRVSALQSRRLLVKFPLNVRLSAMATASILRPCALSPTPPPIPPSPVAALASLSRLMALSQLQQWTPQHSRRLFLAIERSPGAALAPVLMAAYLEAASRAHSLTQAHLFKAIQTAPRHRSLYMRATQLCSSLGLAWEHLLDAMMETDVRLHTLIDELTPIT